MYLHPIQKHHKRRSFLQLAYLGAGLAFSWSCSQQKKQSPQGKVLVIGAGIAGLAAARQLQSQGRSVTVLEGRDRLGGRIFSDRSLGLPIDLGASWIHGIKKNPIAKLAREFDLTTVPTDYGSLKLFLDGQALSPDNIERGLELYEKILKAAKSWGDKQDEDISLGAGIQKILAKKKLSYQDQKVMEWWLKSEIIADIGLDLNQISLHELEEDEAFSGADHLFPNGYDEIIEKLAADLDIRLEEKVVEIKYAQEQVLVKTEKDSFSGSAAIVTLPLGVLKSNTVQFSPPLPQEKQQAINRLTMGLLNKVVLLFPQQFWERKDILGLISKNPGNFPFVLNYAQYQDAPILIALTGGSYAQSIESLSEQELVAEIMGDLRKIYGKAIPNPKAILRTKWSADTFSYGSYSHLPVGVTSQERDILAKPVDNLLFFAGEATSRSYPSTVHGAFLSGVKAGLEVGS